MNEETLFQKLLDVGDAERSEILDRECADRPELRARVEALLSADASRRSPGKSASENTATHITATGDSASTLVGGRYQLIDLIGEGGMGEVWRARQTEPVKRHVAVKLVKVGMDSKAVLARFEAERQALAMMDHPNIAKILDAGLHDGRPFFVMELVKGTPITEYCDARKLTPQERLELFVPVCQAIQHAHQKGIIHRDIKPSNVLIALYDDRAVPKVIDFGIAKATTGALTERTLETMFGGVVGTPQYMSPEQATFNNLDIDTRSDVYSLGVLLYELLAGSTPFTAEELKQHGLLEMLRVVREVDPQRPSIKLSTAITLSSLAANRGMPPQKLAGLLKDELDWIVLKALEKDRVRRYQTASGLAEDVQRYLGGEPVRAVPPSLLYRAQKAFRRNRGAVLTTVALATVLLAATVVSLRWASEAVEQRRIADRQRDETEAARQSETRQREAAEAARTDALRERDAAQQAKLEVRKNSYQNAMSLIPVALKSNRLARAIELLDQQRPAPGEEDLRNFEWHYWDRFCHREVRSIETVEGGTRCLSGDGRRFAVVIVPTAQAPQQRPALNIVDVATLATIRSLPLDPFLETSSESSPRIPADLASAERNNSLTLAFLTKTLHLSHDGQRVAIQFARSGQTSRLIAWHVETGDLLLDQKHESISSATALSADGGTLVQLVTPRARGASGPSPWGPGGTGPDELLRLRREQTLWKWNLNLPGSEPSKTRVSELFDQSSPVFSSGFILSPNGRSVVLVRGNRSGLGSTPGTASFPSNSVELRAVDLAAGQVGPAVNTAPSSVFGFSPDGARLFGVSPGTMHTTIWSVAGSELSEIRSTPLESTIIDLNSLPTIGFGIGTIRCSDDGRTLAGCFNLLDNVCLIIDAETGRVVDAIICHAPIQDFSFNNHLRRLVAFVPDVEPNRRLAPSGFQPRRSPRGPGKTHLMEWVLNPGRTDASLNPPDGDDADGPVAATWWSPSRRLRAVAYQKSRDVVVQRNDGHELLRMKAAPDRTTDDERARRIGPARFLFETVFSPQEKFVLHATIDAPPRIYNLETGTLSWEGKSSGVAAGLFGYLGADRVVISNDQRIASLPDERGFHIVKFDSLETICRLDTSDRSIRLSPDGRLAMSRDLNSVESPTTQAGEFSPPTRSRNQSVPTTLWNLTSGQKIQSFSFSNGPVAFSHDGSTFAISPSPGQVAVWRTGSEAPFSQFSHGSIGSRMELDATGASLLFWSSFSQPRQYDEAAANIIDIASGRIRCRLESLGGPVQTGVFSPDGKRVATVSRSGSTRFIQVWDATTGAELLSLPTSMTGAELAASPNVRIAVNHVSFSSDGRQLILHGAGGQETWDATPRDPQPDH